MAVITTKIVIAADGTVSLATPMPAGEYVASIELVGEQSVSETWERLGLPTWDTGPFPPGLNFGRDEIYGDGDDGR